MVGNNAICLWLNGARVRVATCLAWLFQCCLRIIATATAAAAAAALLSAAAPGKVMAFAGATLYPSPDSAPVRDAVVLVRGKSIWQVGPRRQVKIPAGATVIFDALLRLRARV